MGGDTKPSSTTSAPARDEFPSFPSASSSSSQLTAADLARIAQQEALMDRMMERKLALLEAEYNACINAENSAQQTTAEQAAMHGYDRVGGSGQRLGGEEEGAEEEEEEFSPAWTQFKREMEEERRRQRAEGFDSDDGKEGPTEPTEESKTGESMSRVHAPLTSDKISSIKSVMSGIKLRPPPWAIGMAEEVWMARILERAGFVRKAVAARQQQLQPQQSQQQQPAMTEEERKRRKEKKKARKAKKAREAKQLTQQQSGSQTTTGVDIANTDERTAQSASSSATDSAAHDSRATPPASFDGEDFEAAFPALSVSQSPQPPSSTVSESATPAA